MLESDTSKSISDGTISQAADVVWPEDLLPQDCPTARIVTYGYDGSMMISPLSYKATPSFDSLGREFLQSMVSYWGVYGSKPVIFVAHSLGGLILKDVSHTDIPFRKINT